MTCSVLEQDAFQDWLVEQRWFGSKARDVSHVEVAECIPLREEPPQLALALVEARFGEGTHETYQVLVGLRPSDEGWSERVITESTRPATTRSPTRRAGASCCTACAAAPR